MDFNKCRLTGNPSIWGYNVLPRAYTKQVQRWLLWIIIMIQLSHCGI